MSASNWAVCPKCRDLADKDYDAAVAAGLAAYGKVPFAEFERLRSEADAPVDESNFATFREDYEIYGASDGTVVVGYSGCCQTCGLTLEFKHEHVLHERASS